MIVVYAGAVREWAQHALFFSRAGYRLLSFFEGAGGMKRFRAGPDANKIKLFMDSGAYSAWSQGTEISLRGYMKFLDQWQDNIYVAFNLDTIPGKKGEPRTKALTEQAAITSRANLLAIREYLDRKGAKVKMLPVFHIGENFKWLELLLEEGEDYIAFGGPSWAEDSQLVPWLNQVFMRLTDQQGVPQVKTHGLGLASFDLMRRYPWESCDATSWALTAAYGAVYVPVFIGGKPDYLRNPRKIGVSGYKDLPEDCVPMESGVPAGATSADHYSKLNSGSKKFVQTYLEEYVGITLEDVQTDYTMRARAVVHFYERFKEAINSKPARFERIGGFL